MNVAFDRPASRAAVHEWSEAKKAERGYMRELRKIARHIGEFLNIVETEGDVAAAEATLQKYSQIIEPWAKARARVMVADIARRNDKVWRRISAEMGQTLRQELRSPEPIADRFHALMDEQVVLIKSLPIEAAQRVHNLVERGVIEGRRFTDIIPLIRQGGEVSKSRAELIARTETGRVISNLLQARAEQIDSTSYVWRTMRDAAVRPSHRALEGEVFRWDSPPVCDPPNHRAHPGAIWNCRCYAEPIIPLDL